MDSSPETSLPATATTASKPAGLACKLATEEAWIYGCALTPLNRLIDLLNDNSHGFIDLRTAKLLPGGGPEAISLGKATIRVDKVLLGIPDPSAARRAAGPDAFVKIRKYLHRVRLGIGRFAIEGDLSLPPGLQARNYMVSPPAVFIAVTNARLSEKDGPAEDQPVVIVNALRLSYLAQED